MSTLFLYQQNANALYSSGSHFPLTPLQALFRFWRSAAFVLLPSFDNVSVVECSVSVSEASTDWAVFCCCSGMFDDNGNDWGDWTSGKIVLPLLLSVISADWTTKPLDSAWLGRTEFECSEDAFSTLNRCSWTSPWLTEVDALLLLPSCRRDWGVGTFEVEMGSLKEKLEYWASSQLITI